MRTVIHLLALSCLTACFSDNGRTYFLDPVSGPGYVLNGEHYDALRAIPGVLSVGDRNYEYTTYITFYPTTGEQIASETLASAKHSQGPAYTLAIKCQTEQIPYDLR